LLKKAGTEFNVLFHLPLAELKPLAGELVTEAIARMRRGDVIIREGFDGQFGQIKLFQEAELKQFGPQQSLFDIIEEDVRATPQHMKLLNFDLSEYRHLLEAETPVKPAAEKVDEDKTSRDINHIFEDLNQEQKRAVEHFTGPAMIMAGPGTGKTKTLTSRIAYLILKRNVPARNILAVTFTNKAAEEMRHRLETIPSQRTLLAELTVSTFHALGHRILSENTAKTGRTKDFLIIDDVDREFILHHKLGCSIQEVKRVKSALTQTKQQLLTAPTRADEEEARLFTHYERILLEQNLFDLDDPSINQFFSLNVIPRSYFTIETHFNGSSLMSIRISITVNIY